MIQKALFTTGMSYEGRAGFFECRGSRTKTINLVGYLAQLTYAPSSASKDLESIFHHCGGPVKLVHSCFSARKDLESGFHRCGGPVKLKLACFSARKDPESSFHHWDVL